jgi:nucleoside-diphosphate-sugar epimerase
MRIFFAGASGVIGVRLLPLLVAAGHEVAGMTRSRGKIAELRALGAEPVLCDVYDADALREAVVLYRPEAVMHQLTDLPDDAAKLPELSARNDRMLGEGTRNLLGAAKAANARRILAQSIACPGTHLESEKPAPPCVQVDEAARRTVEILDSPPGIVEVVDEELAHEPHATSTRE